MDGSGSKGNTIEPTTIPELNRQRQSMGEEFQYWATSESERDDTLTGQPPPFKPQAPGPRGGWCPGSRPGHQPRPRGGSWALSLPWGGELEVISPDFVCSCVAGVGIASEREHNRFRGSHVEVPN